MCGKITVNCTFIHVQGSHGGGRGRAKIDLAPPP